MSMPKPGDFGLSQIDGVVGTAVRVGQWLNGDGFANYTHAFVYVGLGRIVEAQPGGAVLSEITRYATDDVVWFSAPEHAGIHIADHARGLLGTPYSFLDYVALAMTRLHIPTAGLVSRYVKSTGHMICSQLVDECYRRAGVTLFPDGRLAQDVTPADLYTLIKGARDAA